MLYNSYDFVETLYNSLSDDGVLVLQLGEATEDYSQPAAQFTTESRRNTLIDLLVDVGFEAMHLYEDGNCGFEAPWTFLVAIKDGDDKAWYRSQAQVDVQIHKRMIRTKSGTHALEYFDGAVMQGYQTPHKVFESVFCREEPTPESCATDHFRESVPLSDFEVKMSTVGDGSGRGVFTKVDIKQGTAISKKEAARPIQVSGSAMALIYRYMGQSEDIRNAIGYIDGYGWGVFVSVLCFITLHGRMQHFK